MQPTMLEGALHVLAGVHDGQVYLGRQRTSQGQGQNLLSGESAECIRRVAAAPFFDGHADNGLTIYVAL